MNIIKIIKLGNLYKIFKIPFRDNSSKLPLLPSISSNLRLKKFNNVIRAKSHISNLILCNDFMYFCTFTVNNNHNREDLGSLTKSINNQIRHLRNRYKSENLDLHFIFIAEKHKKGGYHFHGLLSKDFNKFMYLNTNGYFSLYIFDYLGFNSISFIKDKNKLSSYITKYITKDFENREIGSHCYFASQGLNKPIEELSVIDNGEVNIDFDYVNEYCSIKITEDYNYITNLKKELQDSYELDNI